jgi:septal ring factor EnvC (AmiA/AmiB activator)
MSRRGIFFLLFLIFLALFASIVFAGEEKMKTPNAIDLEKVINQASVRFFEVQKLLSLMKNMENQLSQTTRFLSNTKSDLKQIENTLWNYRQHILDLQGNVTQLIIFCKDSPSAQKWSSLSDEEKKELLEAIQRVFGTSYVTLQEGDALLSNLPDLSLEREKRLIDDMGPSRENYQSLSNRSVNRLTEIQILLSPFSSFSETHTLLKKSQVLLQEIKHSTTIWNNTCSKNQDRFRDIKKMVKNIRDTIQYIQLMMTDTEKKIDRLNNDYGSCLEFLFNDIHSGSQTKS